MGVFGHKQCKSCVEVVEKATFDKHAHGNITREGRMTAVASPMLLITDAAGNIVASRTFNGDLTSNGTLTASRVVGAVYA